MAIIQARTRLLLRAGVSQNTYAAYDTARITFDRFRACHSLGLCWPATNQHVVLFISSCYEKGFSPATIATYCSGISFHHKINSWTDPTDTFVVKKLLEGCRRSRKRTDDRAPISQKLLACITKTLSDICYGSYECTLFSAAYTLAYFGLFRVSELVFTKATVSDRPLLFSDISFDNDRSVLQVCIRKCKTNQNGNPIKLHISASTGDSICCIKNMMAYLKVRPAGQGYLFCHKNNTPLTRYQFSSILSKAIKKIGLPSTQFKTHSFRIGRASDLAARGVSMETIKQMGRWHSDSYKKYIRL